MKRTERIEKIKESAYEYAKSGKCTGWLMVEMMVGYPEARRELDKQYIRDDLDRLCKIAVSEDEKSRRESYNNWVSDIVEKFSSAVQERFPNVQLRIGYYWQENKRLDITGPGFWLRLPRKFNSPQMEVEKYIHDPDGYYRSYSLPEIIAEDFSILNDEEIISMIFSQVEHATKSVEARTNRSKSDS